MLAASWGLNPSRRLQRSRSENSEVGDNHGFKCAHLMSGSLCGSTKLFRHQNRLYFETFANSGNTCWLDSTLELMSALLRQYRGTILPRRSIHCHCNVILALLTLVFRFTYNISNHDCASSGDATPDNRSRNQPATPAATSASSEVDRWTSSLSKGGDWIGIRFAAVSSQ